MKLHIYDDKRWKEIHDIKGSNGVKGGRCRHMVGMRLSIYGPHSLHKQTIFQGTRTEPRFRDSYMVLVSVKDIILLYVFTEDTLTNHYFPKKLRLILYIYILLIPYSVGSLLLVASTKLITAECRPPQESKI